MRPALIFLIWIFAATALVSCDHLKKMIGGKPGDEQKKLEEIAAQVALKIAEQQKQEAEQKAKKEQEIEAAVQKRLAEMQAASPQTQPANQPTTQPAVQSTPPAADKAPVKVVEKGVVKEAAPEKAGGDAPAAAAPTGFVRLFDDAGFTDRSLTVRFGNDLGDLNRVSSDDGKSGFNDKASSVKYSVPEGWQAVLYENNSFTKRGYALKGRGSIADLGYFGDKCSSVRWEKAQEE